MEMSNKFEQILLVNLQAITLFNQHVCFAFLPVRHTFITASTSFHNSSALEANGYKTLKVKKGPITSNILIT